MAPAGNVKREEGNDESVAMSGRSNVDSDLAREFRTQKAAVPWAAIALPEIRFASQSLLKAGFRKAVQIDIFAIKEHLRIEPGVKIVNPSASPGTGELVYFQVAEPGLRTVSFWQGNASASAPNPRFSRPERNAHSVPIRFLTSEPE